MLAHFCTDNVDVDGAIWPDRAPDCGLERAITRHCGTGWVKLGRFTFPREAKHKGRPHGGKQKAAAACGKACCFILPCGNLFELTHEMLSPDAWRQRLF